MGCCWDEKYTVASIGRESSWPGRPVSWTARVPKEASKSRGKRLSPCHPIVVQSHRASLQQLREIYKMLPILIHKKSMLQMAMVWGTVLTPTSLPCSLPPFSTVPGLSHTCDVSSQEVWLGQSSDKVKVQRVKNPHSAVSTATEDVVVIHRDAVCHSGLRRTQHMRQQMRNVFSRQRSPDTTGRTTNWQTKESWSEEL